MRFHAARCLQYLGGAVLLWIATVSHAAGLNDTGIAHCGAAVSGNYAPCQGSEPTGQDAHSGRDAAAAAGELVKIGGGEAGFDFTALDAGGNPTDPSSGANPHSCVRDNVTGLTWEVKTANGGLRDKDWLYSWSADAQPDEYAGEGAGLLCRNTQTVSIECNTYRYVVAVNAAGLCGHSDWRMPTRQELQSIVHYGRTNPAIDIGYFPNTGPGVYWTSTKVNVEFKPGVMYMVYPEVESVSFYTGEFTAGERYQSYRIRLVRGGK